MERSALVIEDDADIRGLIEYTLSAKGFEVSSVADGKAGVEEARALDPDLITLDLGLPQLDGIEVCRRIREFSDAYIIMVSAREDEIDRLIGLEIGADDYLTKPFSPRELGVRATTMLRRPRRATPRGAEPVAPVAATSAPAASDNELREHGSIKIDVDAREAFLDGREMVLTRTEFDLLAVLMGRPSVVWSRETLLRLVWGNEWGGDTHLVEVHMGNLRKKLGGSSRKLIRTVRGVGYRLENPA
ncbi:MAG: response regulator transcription factor [Nocardioides sp.]|nr:response regulator transcription factor [Nocardioides sp.]